MLSTFANKSGNSSLRMLPIMNAGFDLRPKHGTASPSQVITIFLPTEHCVLARAKEAAELLKEKRDL